MSAINYTMLKSELNRDPLGLGYKDMDDDTIIETINKPQFTEAKLFDKNNYKRRYAGGGYTNTVPSTGGGGTYGITGGGTTGGTGYGNGSGTVGSQTNTYSSATSVTSYTKNATINNTITIGTLPGHLAQKNVRLNRGSGIYNLTGNVQLNQNNTTKSEGGGIGYSKTFFTPPTFSPPPDNTNVRNRLVFENRSRAELLFGEGTTITKEDIQLARNG